MLACCLTKTPDAWRSWRISMSVNLDCQAPTGQQLPYHGVMLYVVHCLFYASTTVPLYPPIDNMFPVFTCVSYAEARNSLAIGWTSVRVSVCLSDTRWYCIKTAKHIVMLSSPQDSPFILVLCISRSSRNSKGFTHCGAAKQRWSMKMSQFSTNNLLYLRNG